MAEKPKVLVVYGYHPRETYAFDVGVRLAKDPNREFLVERYKGKADTVVYDLNEYERHLHGFIRSFRGRYAIVLHDSTIPDFRKKLPSGYAYATARKIGLEYEARRNIPPSFRESIEAALAEHFSNDYLFWIKDDLQYSRNYMPERLDELSIEFYRYKRIKKTKAVGFVRSLAQVLLNESSE